MKRELTDAYLRTVKPPGNGRLEIRDNRVSGLVLRITPNGMASWSVRARTKDGKQTRPRLGTWPQMGISKARLEALQKLAAIQAGADPIAEKRAARAARKAHAAEPTVLNRLAEWQAARTADPDKPWSPRHAAEISRLMTFDIPAKLGKKALKDTTRADWVALVTAGASETASLCATVDSDCRAGVGGRRH